MTQAQLTARLSDLAGKCALELLRTPPDKEVGDALLLLGAGREGGREGPIALACLVDVLLLAGWGAANPLA